MRNKILAGFLTLCLLTALNGRDCLASEAPPADSGTDHNTTYTITLYSGAKIYITRSRKQNLMKKMAERGGSV